uniref:Pleckstrin homology domain containing, family A member 7a n=1 Tax=Oryzias sinensis TaxID=183150 RepID=A0A8C8DUS9_9TELE
IMAAPVGQDSLPEPWSYGVCRDGRVFFIDDRTRTTTWLHPRSGEPVNSGHMIRSDLPGGWEEGFTAEGVSYFINHNQRSTSFCHPVTGQISPENMDFLLHEQAQGVHMTSKPEQLSNTSVSDGSTVITGSTVDNTSASKVSRSSSKIHNFGKREQSIKRNPNVPVVVRGWLYKQDSSGMRLWKRKWFVLADFCLFYYKDSREEAVLGSIPLPSYVISPVGPEDHISRKYAFKVRFASKRTRVISSFQSAPTENTLPRRTPPTQHKYTTTDAYQTLPKNLHQSPPAGRQGEYKYAQDRLSHFRIPPGVGGQPSKTVWELYEWHQRQLFRHASPTAPLYTPAPEYPFGPGSLSAVPPSFPASRSDGSPRCVSVPPSSADIPPPGPPPGLSHTLSPNRRPHTPADRVTVRPMGDTSPDVPFTVSPRRSKSQLFKRRSIPPSGYMTHTVSAPSLHGKTDSHHMHFTTSPSTRCLSLQVKLSRLCEQDKILKDLEATISSLKEDKDKLERVLDVSHQQMEQFQEHPSHAQKIAYQQRLLQEDLVTIRAQISRLSTEMSLAWEEYCRLEKSVEQLRLALQVHMNNSATPQQEKTEMKRELWRIEDVMAGLSSSKTNYKITIDSVQNPERKIVPSMSDPAVPPPSAEVLPPPRSSISNLYSHTLPHNTTLKWVSAVDITSLPHGAITNHPKSQDEAPPRPPLPRLYDYEETPPVVPPLPKEASVIRHTSVRGLKRQSDERKRDRESGQCLSNGEHKADLRSYLSEPELPGISHSMVGSDGDHQYSPSQGAMSGLNHSSSISSYVTLRRGPGSSADRPKSAFERLSSPTEAQQLPGSQPRGRMTAEEQLERMKRHQRALVRERKRHLSQGDRSCTSPSSSTAPAPRSSSTTRLPSSSADPASSLSMPDKVFIPERYVESDPEEPPSPEELQERSRRAERIKSLLTKSSYQNMQPPAPLDLRETDSALQQQERIMSVSHMLASEASRKSKLVAGCPTFFSLTHTTPDPTHYEHF